MRNRQIGGFKFRPQYSIDSFILDFYCVELKLAIEIDGDSHLTEDATEYDPVREKHIERFGVSFLRFTNREIHYDTEIVIVQISDKARELKQKLR